MIRYLKYLIFSLTFAISMSGGKVIAGISSATLFNLLDLKDFNTKQRAIIKEEFAEYLVPLDELAKTDTAAWKQKMQEMFYKIGDGFTIYKLARDPAIEKRINDFDSTTHAKVYILTWVDDAFLNNIFLRLAEAYYETTRPDSYVILKYKFVKSPQYTAEKPLFIPAKPVIEYSSTIADKISGKLSQLTDAAYAPIKTYATNGVDIVNDADNYTIALYRSVDEVLKEIVEEKVIEATTAAIELKKLASAQKEFDWDSECAKRGLDRAMEAPILLMVSTGLVETALCYTESTQCRGSDYWTNFTCGFANGIVSQLDVLSVVEGLQKIRSLADERLANQLTCILEGKTVFNTITGESDAKAKIRVLYKCLYGIDLDIDDIFLKYNLVTGFIKNSWDDPYYHGQAAAFVITFILPPVAKMAQSTKLFLIGKVLKKFPGLATKTVSLTKIAEAAGDVSKLKSVMAEVTGKMGKALTFKPSWLPNRAIMGNLDNPKGLIGVYNKKMPNGMVIDDAKRALGDIGFPETYASNFKTASKDGYKMLNTNEWYSKMDEPGFWESFNKPWLDELVAKKADVVMLSDKSNDLLKYQWKIENGNLKYILDDNFQKVKTGFGKEIDYMENLVQLGNYQWDATNGVYKYVGN